MKNQNNQQLSKLRKWAAIFILPAVVAEEGWKVPGRKAWKKVVSVIIALWMLNLWIRGAMNLADLAGNLIR